jgi:ABC-type antimicrobial peptide transport system permease subunit
VIERLVVASLRRRGRQLLLIAAAVGVAAATAASLNGFSARAGERLGADLAEFGPNLTVRPQLGVLQTLPPSLLERIRRVPGVVAVAPVSSAPSALTGIAVRVPPARLDEVAARLESSFEGITATPLLRVSESERHLIHRVQDLLAALSLVTVTLALLSVTAATVALIGERRTEVGLMMALGYSSGRIAGFFAAELLSVAVAAAAAGAVAGDLGAGLLASRVLATSGKVWATLDVLRQDLLVAAAVAVVIVTMSLALTIRRFHRLEPAVVLRGLE